MNPAYRLKITDITEERSRTKEYRDKSGKLVRERIPQTVKREVRVVSGSDRFLHAVIDGFILMLFQALIMLLIGFTTSISEVIALMGGLFFSVLQPTLAGIYYAVFEWKFQSSPGKMLFKRVVINEYAEKPDFNANLGRNFIRLIPFEAFTCLSDRGWHDQWSGTFVVTKEEAEKLKTLRQEQEAERFRKWEEYYRQQAEQAGPSAHR